MICIDPGLRGVGLAYFKKNVLQAAEYIKNPMPGRGYLAHARLSDAVWGRVYSYPARLIVIEHPQVYPGMPKTDLNDLLDVVAVGAACASALSDIANTQTVFPREWKGTVDKQVMLKRIWSKLTNAEQFVVQKTNKSDTEDILDATGIGLWRLNRLNTKNYPGATP